MLLVRQPSLVFVFGSLLLAVVGCTPTQQKENRVAKAEPKVNPPMTGKAAAERDIAVGTLRLKLYGKPSDHAFAKADLLKERLGVELELMGCVITDEESNNSDEYNEVMTQEIARRFGPNALQEIDSDARQLMNRRRGDVQ
jgi:hypothetical protein